MAENKTKHEEHKMNIDEPQTIDTREMSAMQVKLQSFWVEHPREWFNMAEIMFDLEKITSDKRKYALVLSALSPEACHKISDLLAAPPQTECYETIKKAFIDRLAPSTERQLTELLSETDLGEKQPSEILRKIQELANGQVNDVVIRQLWLRKLPEIIKIAIVGQAETVPLNTLSRMADNMFDHYHPDVASIHSPSTSNVPMREQRSYRPKLSPHGTSTNVSQYNRKYGLQNNGPTHKTNTVEARLERLESMFSSLVNDRRSRSRGRSPSRHANYSTHARNRSLSREPSHDSRGVCYYHCKFGSRARKCYKPCSFKHYSKSNEMEVEPSQSKNM